MTHVRQAAAPVTSRQPQRIGQQRRAVEPRQPGRVAFQVADRLPAQARPLGQRLLRQARRQAQAPEQCPEGRGVGRRHDDPSVCDAPARRVRALLP